MFNIAFAAADEQLAEQIKADLLATHVSLDKSYLLVLVTPHTAGDDSVAQAVKNAESEQHTTVILLLADVALPPFLAGRPIIDMRADYQARRFIGELKRIDLGQARLRMNRFILVALMAIILMMFAAAILGIAGGLVAFPQHEYETEAALTDKMIEMSLEPTLDLLMPRSTQDANDFPMTVTAAPTRIRPFVAASATALPTSVQSTLNFINTAAAATMTSAAEVTLTPQS